jgi:hypothetical protein
MGPRSSVLEAADRELPEVVGGAGVGVGVPLGGTEAPEPGVPEPEFELPVRPEWPVPVEVPGALGALEEPPVLGELPAPPEPGELLEPEEEPGELFDPEEDPAELDLLLDPEAPEPGPSCAMGARPGAACATTAGEIVAAALSATVAKPA